MDKVPPPVTLGLRIEVVRMIVRHMVVRRKRHNGRVLQASTEIHNTIAESHDVKGRMKNVVALYDVNERFVHHSADANHRTYGEVKKQQLVGLLQDNPWDGLVYLAVEDLIAALVILYRSLLGKLTHRPHELRLQDIVSVRIHPAPRSRKQCF